MSSKVMEGVKRIHCLGIGGAGMSAIAEILKMRGYELTGSELVHSKNTQRLMALGISIVLKKEDHLLEAADLIVYSSAILPSHPERQKAKQMGIPCLARGEVLGFLMQGHYGIAVGGTHGKTSTVGLIASVFKEQNLDPTVLIGGYLRHIKSHAIAGSSRYFITEADESDRSLLFLHPEIAIVNNVDADHMGSYGHDLNRLIQTYTQFIEQSKKWALICGDDPVLSKIEPKLSGPAIISYGFGQSSMIRGKRLIQSSSGVSFTVSREKLDKSDIELTVPLLGRYNAYNVLAAVLVSTLLGIEDTVVQAALSKYQGVSRRLDRLGMVRLAQGEVEVMDDYGHHPREIQAVTQAIRDIWRDRRLVLVFQAHRYTRTRDLLEEFAKVLSEVDCLLLLPVYAAHEEAIEGVDQLALANAVRKAGGKAILVEKDTLYATLEQHLLQDDLLLFQGAGNVTHMAREFCAKAEEHYGKSGS